MIMAVRPGEESTGIQSFLTIWAPASLVLAMALCAPACDHEDPAGDDDDDSSENPACDPGYVLDTDLPDEFLEDYPDGCVPEACGADRWGDVEVDGDTVYVDASATESGDGTEGSPITSIQAGLDAAGDDGDVTVAVAAGTYFENLMLTGDHDGIRLAGRCRELVRLDGSGGEEDQFGIKASGFWPTDEWMVSAVTVTGALAGGIWLEQGFLTVASGTLVGNNGIGILAAGTTSTLILDDIAVRDTQHLADGTFGRGIGIQYGARLEASSCVVEDNFDVGIFVDGEGTEAVLQGVDVRRTQPPPSGTSAGGIGVQYGAHLEASSCVLEQNTYAGLFARFEDTEVVLREVVVRDTQAPASGAVSRGIEVEDGPRLEAYSCLVEDNAEIGLIASGENTEVVLEETEIRGTTPASDGMYGWGVGVQQGAHLHASSSVVVGNAHVGFFALGEGTELILDDVEVLDTLPSPDAEGERGLEISGGARLEATSCLFGGNVGFGVFADGEDTEVVLQDVEVRDTEPSLDGTHGRGINIQQGARLEASSCLMTGNAELGIIAMSEGTELILHEVEVRDTQRALPMTVGIGLCAQEGASVQATDLVVSGTQGPGLFTTHGGSVECSGCEVLDNAFAGALVWSGRLDLSDTTVSGTVTDANEGGGFGVYVSDRSGPAILSIDGSSIENQPYTALWLDGDGSYEIRDSALTGGYGLEMEYPNGITSILHGDGIVATGGVTAWDGATGLLLENTLIHGAYRAGMILDGSSAELTNNTFSSNPTDLVWQHCTGVQEPGGIGEVPIVDYCPEYNLGVAPLEFNLYLEEPDPLGGETKAALRSFTALNLVLPLSRMYSVALISPIPPPALSTPRLHNACYLGPGIR